MHLTNRLHGRQTDKISHARLSRNSHIVHYTPLPLLCKVQYLPRITLGKQLSTPIIVSLGHHRSSKLLKKTFSKIEKRNTAETGDFNELIGQSIERKRYTAKISNKEARKVYVALISVDAFLHSINLAEKLLLSSRNHFELKQKISKT